MKQYFIINYSLYDFREISDFKYKFFYIICLENIRKNDGKILNLS